MIQQFWKSEDGNYTAIFSIAMIPIMTAVAGVVDYAGTSRAAAELQNRLDATALAIATKYESGMTQTEVQQFGLQFFEANANFEANDANPEKIDQTANFKADAVADGQAIDISASASTTHQGFIAGPAVWNAERASFARFVAGLPACVLALDAHASESVKIQGSTQVQMNGCVIAANSDAADSVSRGGSAHLAAKCISTVGHTVGLSSSTDLECPQPLEQQYPSLDPLAGVHPPAYTACQSMTGGKKKTLYPGTYCNKTWSGEITLNPGTYILRGGQIKLGGLGKLVGHGVTIFLMEGAEFTSNANEVIDLSPSTSAPYAGITVFQEYGNVAPLTINGGSGSQLSGFIYAPSADVFYAGNSDMSGSGECIRIIGQTVEMTGNSAVSSNCEAELGGKKMMAGRMILLIK
jgi:Flp pilus assembly protein TadG